MSKHNPRYLRNEVIEDSQTTQRNDRVDVVQSHCLASGWSGRSSETLRLVPRPWHSADCAGNNGARFVGCDDFGDDGLRWLADDPPADVIEVSKRHDATEAVKQELSLDSVS